MISDQLKDSFEFCFLRAAGLWKAKQPTQATGWQLIIQLLLAQVFILKILRWWPSPASCVLRGIFFGPLVIQKIGKSWFIFWEDGLDEGWLGKIFSQKWRIFDFLRQAKGEICQALDQNCNTVDPNFPFSSPMVSNKNPFFFERFQVSNFLVSNMFGHIVMRFTMAWSFSLCGFCANLRTWRVQAVEEAITCFTIRWDIVNLNVKFFLAFHFSWWLCVDFLGVLEFQLPGFFRRVFWIRASMALVPRQYSLHLIPEARHSAILLPCFLTSHSK